MGKQLELHDFERGLKWSLGKVYLKGHQASQDWCGYIGCCTIQIQVHAMSDLECGQPPSLLLETHYNQIGFYTTLK
jgi:hypothetical protein